MCMQSLPTAPRNPVDDAFYKAISEDVHVNFTVAGKYPITADKIQQTRQSDSLISETVLNGFFIYSKTIANDNSIPNLYHSRYLIQL